MYNILRQYLKQYYEIPEMILLNLIKDFKLNRLETLKDLPYLHSGYVSIMLEKKDG